jgi:hypothetical protein
VPDVDGNDVLVVVVELDGAIVVRGVVIVVVVVSTHAMIPTVT